MRKILFFLLIGCFITGCNLNTKPTKTLRLNFQEGDLPSLHPYHLQPHIRGYTMAKFLFEGLTRINQEGEVELTGAEKVGISPCKTQYTFTLRPHKWSDGTAVTAYHYEKSWKAAIAPEANCPRADLFYVIKHAAEAKKGEKSLDEVGIKALDEKTLFVELAVCAPYFIELISQPIFSPLKEIQTEPSYFNGPFVVKQWKRDHNLLLTPNPHYWGSEKISLEEIEIKMVTDSTTALYLYEKSEIDWIGDPLSSLPTEALMQLPTKEKIVTRPFWIFLNTEHPLLRSASIRQALAQVIDRSAVAEHIFIGAGPLYSPVPSPLTKVSTKIDIEKATQLFEQGLLELGLNRETFPSLTISYSHQARRKSLAEYLKQIWEKTFGIEIKLEGRDWNIFFSNLREGRYEIGGCYVNSNINDPIDLLERMRGNTAVNYSNWIDETYNGKIEQANKTDSLDMRKFLLKEAEEILCQSAPLIPLINQNHTFAHPCQLKGYVINHTGNIDFSRAYFSKED